MAEQDPWDALWNLVDDLLPESDLIKLGDAGDFVDAIRQAGWRPPARRIETAEELDALPDRSIILMHFDTVAQKSDDVWEVPNEVGQYLSDDIDLPATVLWQPEVNR